MGSEGFVDPVAIDVSRLVPRKVASLYSHLVTRPTGRAVRLAVEERLAESTHPSLSVIDLSEVHVLDYSCADEVVAKLLLRWTEPRTRPEVFLLFKGLHDHHRGPVEAVLDRHGLAAVAEVGGGRYELVGVHSPEEGRGWSFLETHRTVSSNQLEDASGGRAVEDALDSLARRRLVLKNGRSGAFHALSSFLTAGP